MKKIYLAILIAGLIQPVGFSQFEGYKFIDLTYDFDENTIFWPTEEGFKLTVQSFGHTEKGFFYAANKFCTAEHGGTHTDAPIHFYEGRQSVDEIPLENLIGKAIIVDVTMQCAEHRDYRVVVEDFLDWEESHGEIPAGSIVLIKTGFGEFWTDRKLYMGTDERGIEAVNKLSFPGLHPHGAEWLVNERKIKAIGIDTPSIDYGKSQLFETHVILGNNNIPIFENVANLDQLPAKDFSVIALPMKIKAGSGAPTRIIALMSK